MSLRASFLAAAFLAAMALPAAAQDGGDDLVPGGAQRSPAVKMFDNFFISLVAARTCDNPDERTMSMFFRNMLIVQKLATDFYTKALPDKSEAEINTLLNARAEKLDSVVKSSIAAKGCTDPEIIKLVQSFDVNARWKPGGQ